MGLTQVTTGGIKDATITTADLADSAITNAKIAGDAVRNASIRNGSIDNDAVVADAAIAGTKITPNFGSQNIVTTGTAATGNLVISDQSPQITLTESDTTTNGRFVTSGGQVFIQAGAAGSGSSGAGIINLTGYSNVSANQVICKADTVTMTGGLTVDTNTLRVDNTNNLVGIGTNAPAENLHIRATTNVGIRLDDSGQSYGHIIYNNGSNSNDALTIAVDEGNTQAASTMRFRVDASEKMRIDSNGNIGIGITSPNTKLHVNAPPLNTATLTTTNCLQLGLWVKPDGTGSNTTGNIYNGIALSDGFAGLYGYDAGASAATGLGFFTGSNSAVAERMRIDNNGRVQIGTTAGWGSNCKLHVSDTSSNCFVTISAADDGNSVLAFSDTAASVRGALDYDHNGDFLITKTAGTERMRIDSTGRTGINCLEDYGGFVQMKPTHNFDNGATGIQSSGTQATLRVRTSSNSSMSLYIGGLDDSIDSARPYLQVGNRSASGPSAFYDLYLCPFGGIVRTKQIIPKEDNQHDLGISSLRWDDIYATNTSIIGTSDRTKKNTIVDSDLGLSFINKLKPVSYKLNGGTRTHYGLIAQDIETVLSEISKPTTGFAGYIKSVVSDVLFTEDEPLPAGKNVGDVKTPGSINYGLRYAEFIAPLIKAVQELSNEVSALKAK